MVGRVQEPEVVPERELRRAVWRLAWPVVAEQALGTVTQVVDMAMVGHLSTEAVTAVGLSFQPFWFVSSIFMGLAVGATAVVARSVGAGDRLTAARVTGQTVSVAAVLGSLVAGAGLSTSLSRGLGAVALMGMVMGGRAGLRLGMRHMLALDARLIWRVLRVGLPAAAERAFTSGGQLAYARQVASLGTVAYAAHSLCLNAESFSYMPGMGFATAATALVGQNLGAGRPRDAERSAYVALWFALATMGGMAVLFFSIPGVFLRIYTFDPRVIALGIPLLRIVAFTQFPEAVGFVLPGALRGAGDTVVVMGVTVVGMWLVRLGLTSLLVFGLGMGLPGAWLAMLADWLVRAALFLRRFRSGHWKSVRV